MSSSLRFAGIDLGSRSVELAILQDNMLVHRDLSPSGPDPYSTASLLMDAVQYDAVIATGYGRQLLEISRNIETVTEIKAYAEGARFLFPDCRTVLDIGGQDIKAISLNPDGRIRKFEMNDRCAAGSGKFLEIMANTLQYTLEEFGAQAQRAETEVNISSMCTVFAESEVTSLMHRGAARKDIALGVHRSIVKRALSMLNRVSVAEPLVFAGGGALNPCLRELIEKNLGFKVVVPAEPQLVGAIGAARIAASRHASLSDAGLTPPKREE